MNYFTDNDLTERNVLKRFFINAKCNLCLYHVIEIWRRNISKSKFNLDKEKKDRVLTQLRKIVYCGHVFYYNKECENLKEMDEEVYNYYMDQWDSRKNLFVPIFKDNKLNFLQNTTSINESFFSYLKNKTVPKQNINKFITHLMKKIKYKRLRFEDKIKYQYIRL